MPERQQLTALEVASGLVVGPGTSAPLPTPRPGAEPLQMLERATLEALQCQPCLVAFSGGRDSSAVLAAATRAARREGLPLPVPTTLRFPCFPETDESQWQELVIRALKLPEWHRIAIDDELDLLGPVATEVLRRHGPMWPASSYMMVPMLTDARGGALLTGMDGDTLFGGWRWARAMAVLSGRVRPRPRDALRVGHAFGPSALRRWRARRSPAQLPWLRPRAQAALDRAEASRWVEEPRRFAARVAWVRGMRSLELIRQAQCLLADDAGTQVVHPLLDEAFLAALARRGGAGGFGTRTDAMHALFGGLLPDELLARDDKADFDSPIWGGRTRDFTAHWDGEGVDHELVDERRLRESWAADSPSFCSALLVQSLWLATASSADKPRPTSKEALK